MISGALSWHKCVTSPERHGPVNKHRRGLAVGSASSAVIGFRSKHEGVQQESGNQPRLRDWMNEQGALETYVLGVGRADVKVMADEMGTF